MERTVEAYLTNQKLVAKAMLDHSTPDANLFWVIRDSYNGSGGAGGDYRNDDGSYRFVCRGAQIPDYPRKAQLLIPERTRIVLAQVGWCPILDIIWDKQDARRGAKDRPSYSYEHILVFTKNPDHYWNREAVLQEYSKESLAQLKKAYTGGMDENQMTIYDALGQENPSDTKRNICKAMQARPGALLRSVWGISSGSQPSVEISSGSEKQTIRSVAAMPLLLAEICVNLGSEPGDWVGDPYAGFGTTLLAAVMWGRNAIGSELNTDFSRAAAKRLEDAGMEGTLCLE
jgi:DNA modification methylase